MTEIVLKKNDREKKLSLSVTGHSGYAEYGRDIVCSAVSILVYAYAQVVDGLKKNGDISKIEKMTLDPGNTSVIFRAKNYNSFAETVKYLFACISGFDLLNRSYPDHVGFRMINIQR